MVVDNERGASSQGLPLGGVEPSPAPTAAPPMATADVAFFKDLGDMVRARTLFFFPFFGAFLTFLFARSQYILDANAIIQIEILATFLAGVSYANTVANFLSRIEEVRLIMGLKLNPSVGAGLVFSTAEQGAISAVLESLSPTHRFEKKHFGWAMYMLWITTGTVLIDTFFKKPMTTATCFVATNLLHAHCGK